jgi:hypothetical protein
MFPYGNPIILEGSGRIKTDSLNQKRIDLVITRFEEWARAHGNHDNLSYIINKEQYNKSLIAFPAAGLAVLSY